MSEQDLQQVIAAFMVGPRSRVPYSQWPEAVAAAVNEAGLVVIPDEPKHYVTFDPDGWFIEHSVACRIAGTLGTCEFNDAIREIADDGPLPELYGRHWIIDVDSEGLPSLERTE